MASKSLGTLTLDLIAKIGGFTGPMDKAARNTKKNSKSISDSLISVGKASALMAIAAGGALAAFILKAEEAEGRIADLSAAAGIARNDFKALSYAFGTVGLSAEKLSEMSRKVTANLGAFMQTGKGAFAEVFDVLAGKVDLTADSLRGLSGPDVLQKVKDAMDQANVPIEQQTFLLDKVSKGAGKLIPLLANQGEVLGNLTDKFKEYNSELLLSDYESSKFGELGDDFDLLQETMKNATIYLASFFAPELKSIINWIAQNVPESVKTLTTFFDSFRDVQDMKSLDALQVKLVGTQESIEEISKKIEYLKEKEGTFGWTSDEAQAQLDSIIGKHQSKLKALESTAVAIREQMDIVEDRNKVAAAASPLPEAIDTSAAKEAQKEAIKLQKEAAKELIKFHEWQIKQADDELDLIYELDAARRESVQKQKDEFNARREEAADWLNVLENENMTELQLMEQHAQDKRDIAEAYYHDGAMSEEKYQKSLLEIDQKHTAEKKAYQAQQNALILSSSAAMFDALAGISLAFGDEQSGTYRALFAASKAFALANAALSLQSAISSAYGDWSKITTEQKIAAAAGIAALAGSVVSNIASMQYTGMAHDGIDSVPQTGTWLLQKGERVTTAATSAKLDKTLSSMGGGGGEVTIINQTTGRVDNVEKQTMDDGRLVIIIQEVMNAELNNPNSRTNKTLTRTRQAPRKF